MSLSTYLKQLIPGNGQFVQYVNYSSMNRNSLKVSAKGWGDGSDGKELTT